MFWNPFKKPEKKTDKTFLSFSMEDDTLFIEMNIADYSDTSIENFAKLLAGIATTSFTVDTINLVKDAMQDHPDKYIQTMEIAAIYAQIESERLLSEHADLLENSTSKEKDEPYIKPSDTL